MKRSFLGIAAVVCAAVLAGCASTSKTQSSVKYEFLDWQGRAGGAEVPAWIAPALSADFDGLPASLQRRLEGRNYVIVEAQRPRSDANSTTDLRLAQEAAAASYMVAIARNLNAGVDARYAGVLSEREDTQRTLLSTAAEARFTGFEKVADGWVLNRVRDPALNAITDTYSVVQIYACDMDLWRQQAEQYIQQLGLNSDSEELQEAAAHADEIAEWVKGPSKTTIKERTVSRVNQ